MATVRLCRPPPPIAWRVLCGILGMPKHQTQRIWYAIASPRLAAIARSAEHGTSMAFLEAFEPHYLTRLVDNAVAGHRVTARDARAFQEAVLALVDKDGCWRVR